MRLLLFIVVLFLSKGWNHLVDILMHAYHFLFDAFHIMIISFSFSFIFFFLVDRIKVVLRCLHCTEIFESHIFSHPTRYNNAQRKEEFECIKQHVINIKRGEPRIKTIHFMYVADGLYGSGN